MKLTVDSLAVAALDSKRSDASVKTSGERNLNLAFGHSVLRSREARTAHHGFSQLNGLFICHDGSLNGAVIHGENVTPVSSNVDMLVAAPFREQSPNRETASCHTVAGTCGAPLRRVLWLGHARKHPSYRPTVKENDSALNGHDSSGKLPRHFRSGTKASSVVEAQVHYLGRLQSWFESSHVHSKHYGFLSLFALGTTAQNVSGSQGNVPVFAWGDCFVFCFSLCFNFSCSSTVQISTAQYSNSTKQYRYNSINL